MLISHASISSTIVLVRREICFREGRGMFLSCEIKKEAEYHRWLHYDMIGWFIKLERFLNYFVNRGVWVRSNSFSASYLIRNSSTLRFSAANSYFLFVASFWKQTTIWNALQHTRLGKIVAMLVSADIKLTTENNKSKIRDCITRNSWRLTTLPKIRRDLDFQYLRILISHSERGRSNMFLEDQISEINAYSSAEKIMYSCLFCIWVWRHAHTKE